MTHPIDEAPDGWRELCALLQTERDPARFREILKQIDHLLSAHEKADREGRSA
jgi:hypothetical protein